LMLATSVDAGPVIFIVIASAILVVAIVLSSRPRVSSSVMTGLALAGGVGILAAGVVGASTGEREFHHIGVEGTQGVRSVSNHAVPLQRIRFDGEALSVDQLTVPKGVIVTITFINDTDEAHALVVELGPDSDGD